MFQAANQKLLLAGLFAGACVGVAFAIVGLLLLRKSFPNLPSSGGLRGIPRIVSISVMM